METPQLFRIIIPVRDIDEAAAFYETLLALAGRRVAPGRHYFDCGATILACLDAGKEGSTAEFRPNPEHVYFAVEDLEAALGRASEAGCRTLDVHGQGEGIATRPWGERSFYVHDPSGNPLCVVEAGTEFTGR